MKKILKNRILMITALILSAVLLLSSCGEKEKPELEVTPTPLASEAPKTVSEDNSADNKTVELIGKTRVGGLGVETMQLEKGRRLEGLEKKEAWYALTLDGKSYLIDRENVEADPEDKSTGTVCRDNAPLYSDVISYGQIVKVLTAGEKYCLISYDGVSGKLPSWAVCLQGEKEYSPWAGFAAEGTELFADYGMKCRISTHAVNSPVQVLYETEKQYYVEIYGKKGYVSVDSVSKTAAPVVSPEDDTEDDWTPPTF